MQKLSQRAPPWMLQQSQIHLSFDFYFQIKMLFHEKWLIFIWLYTVKQDIRKEKKEDKIPKKHPVVGFPDRKPDLKAKQVKFVSRKLRLPRKNSDIRAKHFEERFLKKGLPTTLRQDLNPVPTFYCTTLLCNTLLPSQTTGRVAPKDRSTLEDDLNESLYPTGYQLKKMRMKQYVAKQNTIQYFQFHKYLKQLLLIKCYMLCSFHLFLLFPYQNGFGNEVTVVKERSQCQKTFQVT